MPEDDEDRILQALSQTEGSFADVVAAVKDYAIFALDPGGHVKTWNEGARRIKGFTRNEIIGKHFSTFYTNEDKKRNHPAFEPQQALKKRRAGVYARTARYFGRPLPLHLSRQTAVLSKSLAI